MRHDTSPFRRAFWLGGFGIILAAAIAGAWSRDSREQVPRPLPTDSTARPLDAELITDPSVELTSYSMESPSIPVPKFTLVKYVNADGTLTSAVKGEHDAYRVNTRSFQISGTVTDAESDDKVDILPLRGAQPVDTVDVSNSAFTCDIEVQADGTYTYVASIRRTENGTATDGECSEAVAVDVRLRGPHVRQVQLDELSSSSHDYVTVYFDSGPLTTDGSATHSAENTANYRLIPKTEEATGATNPTSAELLEDQQSIRLTFDKLRYGRYELVVYGKPEAADGSLAAADGIHDLYGNPIGRTSETKVAGENFMETIVKVVPPKYPALTRGVRHTTGPYVEFPEFLEPRKRTQGFNPSDHVETRVVRLYYFRDAHRAAQIVNRLVQSYNRQGVAVAEQIASKTREDARVAVENRRLAEDAAIQAARKAREAERRLQQIQQQIAETVQKGRRATRDRQASDKYIADMLNPRLSFPHPSGRNLSMDERQELAESEEVNPRRKQISEFEDFIVSQLPRLQSQAAAAEAEVQAARAEEARLQTEVLKAQANEDRLKEQQFRMEVAAAHEDPDTYVPGKIDSDDPVRQVSISVIGEGVIQLRGPIKGINIIRLMLNQIDAPVGQVSIAVHSVQVNGEKGERMESVAGRIEQSIDHARFMTLRSAEMLRNAVATVASRQAMACQHARPTTQPERDQRYLCNFFGTQFIDELDAMESEFLQTGNKVLSLHSMDVTSLPSALMILALAKTTTRMEILQEFENQLRCRLPADERRFLCSTQWAPIRGLDKRHGVEGEPSLAVRATFPATFGMFNGEIHGPDTINPLQREFIRLSQIFKARLVLERELKQRLRERAVIEERIGDYEKKLREAYQKEEQAQNKLSESRQLLAEQRRGVLESILQGLGLVPNFSNATLQAVRSLQQGNDRLARAFGTGESEGARSNNGNSRKSEEIAVELPAYASKPAQTIMITPNGCDDNGANDNVVAEDNEQVLSSYVMDTIHQVKDIHSELERKIRFTSEGTSAAWDDLKTQLQNIKEHCPHDGGGEGRQELHTALVRAIADEIYLIETVQQRRDWVETMLRNLFAMLRDPDTDLPAIFIKWGEIRSAAMDLLPNLTDPAETAEVEKLIRQVDEEFQRLVALNGEYVEAKHQAQEYRRPLDHKKFLDMLIDEIEDKYIELLEGTRAQTANIDGYLKRLSTALADDFQGQFYDPAFRQVRAASRECEVQLGQIETTSILANNRAFAKVEPEATMEFDLPKRDIMITEAMKGAKALMDEYGALLNDPTFLAMTGMLSGQPTSAGGQGNFPSVRSVLPGLPGNPSERMIAQTQPANPEFGAALEKLIPDPAVYKFETGTGYEIRPVIQPDGQSVTFHFNYLYTTEVREPVRADEKHLGRVRRHYIDTDVQLSNYELREVSRYTVALKASRTSRGVPLLEDIPVAGALFRPLPSDESSLQQNIIMAQATIFPTLFDLMGMRWAPAVSDLDPLRLANQEFLVQGRRRALMNQVFDYSSSQVDEFLQIEPQHRRGDLYRSQESIPHVHPNGYRGPGLNVHDSQMRRGAGAPWGRTSSDFIPSAAPGGPVHRLDGPCRRAEVNQRADAAKDDRPPRQPEFIDSAIPIGPTAPSRAAPELPLQQ